MPEIGVGEPIRQQIERLQYRQSRANQRHELLVENEKALQVELLLATEQSARRNPGPARPDRVNQKALLGVALAQLLLSTRIGRLIVNLAAAIRVFEDPL